MFIGEFSKEMYVLDRFLDKKRNICCDKIVTTL